MTSPTYLMPIFFAWVDEDQTTFDPDTMNVVDENIFSIKLKHDEGQIPTLEAVIQNPYTGLLAPGRKVWAWFAYNEPNASGDPVITPFFFGVLSGVPDDLFKEQITLKFLARSSDYIERKQQVAETLKTPQNYDPIFLSTDKRDEPDAILEGWSSLYHVDRTTLAVTASDILEGEDGTITFTSDGEDFALYDSVSMRLGQPPLTTVQVQATVNWTQRYNGILTGPTVHVASYTGETFLSDWPKPGSGLGGGWSVETSFVDDVYKVSQTPMASSNYSWHQTAENDPDPQDCDTSAVNQTASWPALLSPDPQSFLLTMHEQTGICDPFADPPTNRPATVAVTGVVVPQWFLTATWTLRYQARRQFSELVTMDVNANTQAILLSPTVEQDTEVIKVSGADVGQPILTYEAWTDFAGAAVGEGQLIYPNDPTTAGGRSYQVCVQAGTAGSTEPAFSDVPGTITDDNTVRWASLGDSPPQNLPNWSDSAPVPVGQIIAYEPLAFDSNTGKLELTGQFAYYIATTGGMTNSTPTEITYVPPVTDSDEPTPAPVDFFYIAGPTFNPSPGATIGDGSVVWTSLGTAPSFLGIPIGGTDEAVTANNYFPTARGQQSIQYLLNRARAKLRMRARAVTIGWSFRFDQGLTMSCRKNATLYDARLPGGVATGKITSYSLEADGNGKFIGSVEIGCAVGFGGSVSAITGTPEYTAATGYMLPGYQKYDGGTFSLSEEDISYTPPAYAPFDDGLSFPLTSVPSDGSALSGNTASQIAAIQEAGLIMKVLATEAQYLSTSRGSSDANPQISGLTPANAWWLEQQNLLWTAQELPYVMEANPVSWTITIKPVTNGPFNGSYNVDVSTLEIPQGINLSAG